MAIKGKKKPKARGGRAITPGPRPAYVPPKVPPFQRTGAKFLAVLILETVIFALLVGFGEQSQADRQRERIAEFTSLIDAALSSGGDAIQPLPGGAQVLPQLPSMLTQLEGGEPLGEEVVIPETEGWVSALGRAADRVSAVEVPGEDLDPPQILALSEARNLMDRGLRLFIGLADQLRVAIQIEGEPQTELLTSMATQMALANAEFNTGYGKLQEVRRLADLPTTAGVPGGGFPPPLPPGFDPSLPGGADLIPTEPGAETGGGGGGGGNGGGNGGGGGGGGGGNG